MKVHVLSVNGGEDESFLGVFESMASVDAAIKKEVKSCGFTSSKGWKTTALAKSLDPEYEGTDDVLYARTHEKGNDPFEWALLFTVRIAQVHP